MTVWVAWCVFIFCLGSVFDSLSIWEALCSSLTPLLRRIMKAAKDLQSDDLSASCSYNQLGNPLPTYKLFIPSLANGPLSLPLITLVVLPIRSLTCKWCSCSREAVTSTVHWLQGWETTSLALRNHTAPSDTKITAFPEIFSAVRQTKIASQSKTWHDSERADRIPCHFVCRGG